jgi:hypothetical protein
MEVSGLLQALADSASGKELPVPVEYDAVGWMVNGKEF